MPRSRRRHHSKSRSRSRSHSHDRDREPKRRKIESYDSPHHRRSVSSEPEANQNDDQMQKQDVVAPVIEKSAMDTDCNDSVCEETESDNAKTSPTAENKSSEDKNSDVQSKSEITKESTEELSDTSVNDSSQCKSEKDEDDEEEVGRQGNQPKSEADAGNPAMKDLKITPKKVMSPKQIQKRMESEKKRLEKVKEREEREKKRQEERDEKKRTKEKLRIEKEGQKLKEKEQRDKEKEQRDKEKEMRRKEKEEKDEQKRKEKELEKMRKQQEIDEKNKEKLKQEEKKQKTAAAFVNFFVPKKSEIEERKKEYTSSFMPFEIKSDMRLAPLNRRTLSTSDKENIFNSLENQQQEKLYLSELKNGKTVGKDGKTWIFDDGSDDVTILDDLGESIVEQKAKMKAKFLKFHENRRPPYYGTWRKTSRHVKPRKPLGIDSVFNYEIDSDDEWEDEEDGEDIVGSDEEDKENESENDNDYEVDNDVFVPHGHLSDDEVDDEDEVFNPEAQKAKLKFMNSQFEEERKSKTAKIKPRVIGCIWYENNNKVEEAITRYLQPLSVICNNPVIIRKRSESSLVNKKNSYQGLDKEYMPDFLRLIHGNTCKKQLNIVDDYLNYLNKKNLTVTVHKYGMAKQLKECAQWMKCPEEGPMFKVPCWYVSEDVQREYNVKLELPNKEKE